MYLITIFFFAQLHPDFDVKTVLTHAIAGRKLLVTIPWLVEYLAMLDVVTMQLDYYKELFHVLYSIYAQVNQVDARSVLCVMPTSKLIIRACLGWLFDHENIPESYYNTNNIKNALQFDVKGVDSEESSQLSRIPLHPLLENMLTAACPFLTELRISMIPQKTTKVVSRTGRYRHITTKFQDTKQVEAAKTRNGHNDLIEAFLLSQTPSVRKTTDFVVDRATSAVVKDFQVKHLIQVRRDAKAQTEECARSTKNVETLTKEMTRIFSEFLIKLHDKWNSEVKENCRKRICSAFDSLMPVEMLDEVKNRLIAIAYRRTIEKIEEWRVANISSITVFTKDIGVEARKLFADVRSQNVEPPANLIINLSTSCMPSDLFSQLQYLLHLTSSKPAILMTDDLIKHFAATEEIIEQQSLPPSAHRNLIYFLLQLMTQLIFCRPDCVTKELKTAFFKICRHEKISPFARERDSLFSYLITPRLFVMYEGRSAMSFELYADFLLEIADEKYTDIDQIVEKSVQLYRCEWSKECLNNISILIDRLKSSMPQRREAPEDQLFVELISDLCKDMKDMEEF